MGTTSGDLKALFSELVALEPAARTERLSAIGRDDPALREALQGLLTADEHADDLLARLEAPGAAASPDPYGLAGRTLGHFRVLEPLGAGGMGVVYRAEDVRLGRDVALKLLPPHLGLNPAARRLFLREARAAAALDHPNIATVFEVGEAEGGQLFHATALYRGDTLRQRLERGPLPPAEALAVARQVLHGLAHAHAAGVVHRDLKPENLILTPEGAVKIVDFGLATLPGTSTAAPLHAGTAAYMAPEQLRGEPGDARSDLWALGVVLYEMLAGRRPFQGDSGLGLAERILNDTPAPLSSLRPEVPPPVEQVVGLLLQREPGARPASAEEVLAELEGATPATPPASGHVSRAGSPPGRRRLTKPVKRYAWLLLAGLAVVAGAYFSYDRLSRAHRPPVRSIAVLPFDNLSADSATRYIGPAIADQVLDELGRIEGLRVPARTSSFAYGGKDPDVRRIGRELDVASVLEGTYIAVGDRIRVSAQLVNTRDGAIIWSERYNRPLTDILTLQDDIAGAIAATLAARLRPPTRARAGSTPSLAAFELYREGRNLWFERTPASLLQAKDRFQRALALDPTYALAYAGLADVYAMLGSFEYAVARPAEAYDSSRAAAQNALRLDPDLAQAYAALGNVAMNYDRDWADAEAKFRRAIEMDRGYAPAHQWYAFLLAAEHRNEEALHQLDQAGEIDPRSPLMASVRAQYFYFVRDTAQARRALAVALQLDPRFGMAHLISAQVDMQTGRLPAAIARLTQLRSADPDNPVVAAVLGYAYGRSGDVARARALRAWLATRAGQRYVPAELPGLIDLGLGDYDSALAGMERAFNEHSGGVLYLPLDPLLDPLRSDPRFQRLLQRLPH